MNAVSIDVENLEQLPARTALRLLEKRQTLARHVTAMTETLRALAPMFLELERLDIEVSFDTNTGCIDVAFTGSGERLREVWGLLRRNGYLATERPKSGESTYSAFWSHASQMRIWFSFSSTVCKRVKIGTKMVETPIYETQCGELPVLDLDGSDVVPA